MLDLKAMKKGRWVSRLVRECFITWPIMRLLEARSGSMEML